MKCFFNRSFTDMVLFAKCKRSAERILAKQVLKPGYILKVASESSKACPHKEPRVE
ncbi:hypothetical protein KPL28_05295 [Clostridium algidicarnis]|uniref:hypothetical protein n=1 Tax=Clostridium algidicarnis TaxID=37659 RepID=UPI001C0E1422|nr:hypothetical protein [Clostridium algidicarnis]MBU3209053.1 hypothetical protein [Clostridium algidicarnis]